MGRLRDSTLGDVLGACIRARLDGALSLDDGACERRIHLRRGEVLAVEADAPRLGELAVAAGALSQELLDAALDVHRGPTRLGQWLVLARWISPPTRDALLVAQRSERLEALFRLTDCDLRWSAPAPLPTGAAELPPLPAGRVLAGRPRRRARGPFDADRRAALEVLGLPHDATPGEITARYRSLVLALHPDRSGTRSQRLDAVLSAWRALSSTCAPSAAR